MLAYIGAYTVLGAVLAAVVVTKVPALQTHRVLPWSLLAAVFVATDFVQMKVRSRGEIMTFDLFGVPAAVGAVYTSRMGLIAAVTLAVAASSLVSRNPLHRSVFNVANHVVGASVARVALGAVLGAHASPIGPLGVASVALACLVFELTTMTGVVGAVTISAGWPGGDYLKSVARNSVMVFPLSSVLAVITIAVVDVETWGLALLAAPAIFLSLWYRAVNRSEIRFTNLEKLYAFMVRLSELSDTDEIIAATLEESRRTLGAERAQLRLPASLGGIRCVLDTGGEVARDFEPLTPLETQVSTGPTSVVVPSTKRMSMPAGYHARDLMAVPVPLGDLGTAVMVVTDHDVEDQTFDAEDLRFFEAFAANLGTALTSSQRLDWLRLEVAAREHQALHDSLTGLGNRTLFQTWVDDALRKRRPQQRVGVMVMDLDGFKDINDTLGHHTGDAVLKEVAGRVLLGLGADRLAARLGGDEFAFVLPAANSAEDVTEAARTILDAVSQPVAVDGMMLELRASIGVAVAPADGVDAATLLRRADVAMYAAKGSRRGVVAYDREIDQYAKRRLILANELRHAMDGGQLEVWYQPVAQLSDGLIVGFEALLRWRHPEHGSISPNEFIPVAEQSGLIEPLTWWVLKTALKDVARWRSEGYELSVAVNVSARSLLGPDVQSRLSGLLSEIGVPPAQLTLEITESLMMGDPDGSQRVLEGLAGLGVEIAIDDFGTGYSSLSRLRKLPVQTVKIDRSFVLAMHRDDSDEAIVKATIELARNMGHHVVAEGVERQETWDRLLELGCDLMQGHLLAPAMPVDMCRRWLRDRQAPRMAAIHPFRRAQGA